MKKTIIIVIAAAVILAGVFYFLKNQKTDQSQEQTVLEETLTISQKYSTLRYRTDNVLINAKDYGEYDAWNKELTDIIKNWEELEKDSSDLEKSATKMAEGKISFNLMPQALAYSTEEVTNIINKAPMGKQIRTLSKHLGVDAKMAQLILNQTQDQITREAYGEEGDVFEECEQNSMRIKNGAKVTVFVGGVVLTGGTSAIAASGALAKTALVVSGADLVLEVADDEAKIALGDKNKVSEMVGKLRVVTEPAAGILTLANIPGNLTKAADKVSAAYFGADQVRSAIQDEKILGISIKIGETGETKASVSGLTEQELPEWMKENKAVKSGESVKEILNQIEKETKEAIKEDKNQIKDDDKKEEINNIAGSSWEGTLSSMSGGDNEKRTIDFDFTLNQDGSVGGASFKKWKQEGDRIKLYGEDESIGYYEFKIGKKDLLLTKIVIGDELIQPGEDYMGGIAPGGFLNRKSGSGEGDSQTNKNAMAIAEYNEMDDKGLFKDISSIEKYLGKPDIKTTDDNGRIIYVYYDLVKYDNGNLGSVKMAFYNEEDYKSYIKGMGASWESNKENWDESGGGIRSASEIRGADTYKQIYGE